MNSFFVDFSKVIGKIKPMHGVNNGPLFAAETKSVVGRFIEAGIPNVRLHDTVEADIPRIFTNFDADPTDPNSYDFRHVDAYVNEIYKGGADLCFRLGTTIEHRKNKDYIHPPKDYDKWAEVCCAIIRHFTKGWANGYHYDVPFWEIWNEPDNNPATPGMWTGTPEQYYRLYVTATKRIKAEFPEAKVGGFASCFVENKDFREGFFQYITKEKAPLDFYSWHGYASKVTTLADSSAIVQECLDRYGFGDVKQYCNEWNFILDDPDFWPKYNDAVKPGSEKDRRAFHELQASSFGASFVESTFICMQNTKIAGSNYYAAPPTSGWSGMFDRYGIVTPVFYAFKAYNALYRLSGGQVEVKSDKDNIQILAAVGDNEGAVLISNHEQEDTVCAIEMNNLFENTKRNVEIYLVDNDNELALVKKEFYTGEKTVQYINVKKNSIVLIKIIKD